MPTPNTTARVREAEGFRRMFAPERLTLGIFFPIESSERTAASLRDQERRARRAEALGFAALWFRDVPLRDPSVADQVHDPWGHLGWIAAQTTTIALATASVILPLRHPLHTAKAAASIDRLSGERLVLGVASGDRPVEFPAFGVDYARRDALFRDNFQFIRTVLEEDYPTIESPYGTLMGIVDLVPKPAGRLPMMVAGDSRQTLEWIAEHADGWINEPRPLEQQAERVLRWREAVERWAPGTFKPFAQSLGVDLAEDPEKAPTPIHMGLRGGRNAVLRFLEELRALGVNHVMLNLASGKRDAADVLEEIGRDILPELEAGQPAPAPLRAFSRSRSVRRLAQPGLGPSALFGLARF